MATYEYSCSCCGPFDVRLPMGEAPARHGCPRCSGAARRVYSSRGLTPAPSAVTGLREQEEKSRENPSVVTRVPPRAAAPKPVHPAVARLPRP
ncbi:FmdB family zinc ribbon protein [Streptomyces sp. NPDC046831]|uniref:FmdB family zinc ribbon protein n=1 Tax=Streptomyces sp. NPDC046831 TaxID=3154805 RepID=UPI0034066D28